MARKQRVGRRKGPDRNSDRGKSLSLIAWVKRAWANAAYRFVFFFLVYLGMTAVAYSILTGRFFGVVEAMMTATAQIEGFILGLLSSNVSVSGQSVTFLGFPVRVIEECTGIYEILIFIAAVMAFPTTLKKKGVGLALGVPLMYLFNIVRILVLIIVGRYYYSIFDFMHLYFWQVTLILMITSVWVLWILKVVNREEAVPATDA
ncbi:MAG: exosortase H [Candidatus Zixiibacteriota bacterium]